jgi:hypothetical protein
MRQLIMYLFKMLSTHTSDGLAVCAFAIASGTIHETGRFSWMTRSISFPRVERVINTELDWQVKRVFEWILYFGVAQWFKTPFKRSVLHSVIGEHPLLSGRARTCLENAEIAPDSLRNPRTARSLDDGEVSTHVDVSSERTILLCEPSPSFACTHGVSGTFAFDRYYTCRDHMPLP